MCTTCNDEINNGLIPTGATGAQGPQGIQGDPGKNAFKLVKEITTDFGGDFTVILQSDFCSPMNDACLVPNTISTSFADFHIQAWVLINTSWILINQYTYGDILVEVSDVNGDIKVTFDMTPLETPARVRIVILG